MKKKSTLIIALVVCLLAILTVGSLAYFTDSKTVKNEFMTTSYDPENPDITADELFSIKVFETENDQEVTERTYENVTPGDVLAKDPTVRNTGKYDQWIRMQVTFSNAAAWKAALGTEAHTSVLTLNTGWTLDTGAAVENTQKDEITYTYYLNSKLVPEDTATLFTQVTIPADMTVDQMVGLAKFTISITADAIQADNTGDSAQAAFTNCWGK